MGQPKMGGPRWKDLTEYGPLEKGMANQYSCLENPMNSMERQNDKILKEELPRSVGAQYATGDQWRNNSRKNEGMEPKQLGGIGGRRRRGQQRMRWLDGITN